jgi:hypothetical protein
VRVAIVEADCRTIDMRIPIVIGHRREDRR